MRKKGAIELSVTAIIVLIIAIVILGLILGFVRNMFSDVSSQFEAQATDEPEPATPSPSNPITLSRTNIITSPGKSEVVRLGVYNPTDYDWNDTTSNGVNSPSISCGSDPVIIGEDTITKEIDAGQTESYIYLFTTGNVAAKTYLCSASIIGNSTANEGPDTYTKELTIKVKE